MNDTGLRTELAGLLPRPPEPTMPAERMRLQRARVLTAVEQRGGSPVRRRGLLLIAAPAAVVLAVTLAVTVVARPWDRAGPPVIVQVLAGDHDAATAFLDGLALRAGSAPGAGATDGRYLYVRSRVAFTSFSGGENGAGDPVEATLQPLHDREIWKPLFAGGRGRLEEAGRPSDLGVFRAIDVQPELPADPGDLLRELYAEQEHPDRSPHAQAFTRIGDLLHESMLSPAVNAALYQAAARIPGVELVPGAVDAAGRRGVGVARVDDDRRIEWIFEADGGAYLGERSYLIRDTEYGTAGLLLSTTAVTRRAVVDRLGATP